MSKVKKIIFPSTTLVFSFYFSVLFGFGVILGYLITDLFCKKFLDTGKVKSIFLKIGNYKIHLHHWLSGSIVFLMIYLSGYMCLIPKVVLGMLGGLIVHDLYLDKEWYRVLLRERKIRVIN